MGARNSEIRNHARPEVANGNVCQHTADGGCILALAIEATSDLAVRDILQDAGVGEWNPLCLSFALQSASSENLMSIAVLLLTQGANINFVGGPFETALQAAIVGGHVQMVEWLLQHGATVNTETPLFCTPLQAATAFNQTQIVHVLLRHGADTNQVAGPYHTALQVAAVEGRTDIMKDLLEYGADASIQGGLYGDALQAAASIGRISLTTSLDCTKSLLDQCRLRLRSSSGMHAVHLRNIVMLLDALNKDQGDMRPTDRTIE
jgi:hypothetical protein